VSWDLTATHYRISVTPAAQPAFEVVLKIDPKELPERYLHQGTALVVVCEPADESNLAIDAAATWAKWREITAHAPPPQINIHGEAASASASLGAAAASPAAEPLQRISQPSWPS
jgi:hypothetical protein